MLLKSGRRQPALQVQSVHSNLANVRFVPAKVDEAMLHGPVT